MLKLQIVIYKGLPGSGKSTEAKAVVASSGGAWKRVNKDDLRRMIDAGTFSHKKEQLILDVRDTLIASYLLHGYNVIVDDTNLGPRHEERIRRIFGDKAEVSVKFFDTPLDECIKRDLARPVSVGEKLIRRMYNQYLRKPPIRVEWTPGLSTAIIVDIDGTVALHGSRSPYDTEKCDQDTENPRVVDLVVIMKAFTGTRIIFVTGREEKYREKTEKWLKDRGIPVDELYMRPTEDHREDSIVKEELFDKYIRGRFNIRFVLDDRNRVVAMWRRLGLTVLQVADGDF